MSVRLAQIKADIAIYRNTVRQGDAAFLVSEVRRLQTLVDALRPLAESDPCWTVDSVCGYCEGRAGDGADYHKPDCEWVKANAAIREAPTQEPLEGAREKTTVRVSNPVRGPLIDWSSE